MRDAFSYCHPAVNFMFYIGAIVLGMCFIHPVAVIASVVMSVIYYCMIMKRQGRYLLVMLGLWMAVVCINPLFNPLGDTVLFTYFGERSYTFEALCYGGALGAIFVTVLTWFATYNQVMTSDKFLYCFGRLSPAVTLILTLVLRLVPLFKKKGSQILGARRCIGKSVDIGSVYEKAEQGMTIVSALTSWALEGGIVMADSMQSRGYGCGKRSSFSIYTMRTTDKGLLVSMFLLIAGIIVCGINGGMQVVYLPNVMFGNSDRIWTWLGLIGYILFLSIPVIINIVEDARWHILRSKI